MSRWQRLAVWGLCLAGAVSARQEPPSPPVAVAAPAVPVPAVVRVTSSFEASHALAVLRQVAKLFSAGFVRRDADTLAKQIDVLPADQSQSWQFQATYKGVSVPLQVRARLDDFGMLDLDFFTTPAAGAPLRAAVDNYLNSRGL